MIDHHLNLQQIGEGATLLIDKPLQWTSFDAVNKLKWLLKKSLGKNFKIGHAGTLDPLATGLLVVCTGKSTKTIQGIQDAVKEYTGSFYLGATRPSFDKETAINETFEIDHITSEMIYALANKFIGNQMQDPPVFSAIKKDGKPAYLNARKGIDTVLQARNITIEEFEITRIDMPIVEFRIVCSKGTYIRSIAQDFGKALHSGAYLNSLCRTRIGNYLLTNASSIDEMIEQIGNFTKEEKTLENL